MITDNPSEPTNLDTLISTAVDGLPEGPGKEDAKTFSPVVHDALQAIATDVLDAVNSGWTASVSGHGGGNSMQLSISFTKSGESAAQS